MQRLRELDKAGRHKLISSVVTRRRIGTQHELLEALARAGCRVTQATISRDVRRAEPSDALAGVLAQFGRSATAAQNIVVVQSELGSAPAIARSLDRLGHPRIVGTIAGDDTCLVIARDAAEAAVLAEELSRTIGA
jgi:transcriptional regulator of arginine metabolism